MRVGHVFLIALFLSLLAHGVYWRNLDDSPDQQSWIREMAVFGETSFSTQRSSLYYGYPATTLLGAAHILSFFGVPSSKAFAGIMTMSISIPIALCVMICRILRPKSAWWVGAMGLLILSQLYYGSTPPSAIVTVYVTLLMLYALYLYEKRKDDPLSSILFGGIAGVALATRLDISLIILFFLCGFLFPVMKKHMFTVVCSAFVVFALCNPYMWAFPAQHLADIIHKITYHTNLGTPSPFPLRQLALTVPLSTMGLLASMLVLLFPNALPHPLPRRFLAVVLSACISVSAALMLFSTYHPAWYFYPLLQIFEVLFVLYLLDALAVIGRGYATIPLLVVLIAGNAVVFFRKLFL